MSLAVSHIVACFLDACRRFRKYAILQFVKSRDLLLKDDGATERLGLEERSEVMGTFVNSNRITI